jgi:hypothetical protein
MISPRSVIGVLCTTHHDKPCVVHNKSSHRAGTQARGKPGRLGGGIQASPAQQQDCNAL